MDQAIYFLKAQHRKTLSTISDHKQRLKELDLSREEMLRDISAFEARAFDLAGALVKLGAEVDESHRRDGHAEVPLMIAAGAG